jgi:purine-binding chemotaxis protein CheW
MKLHVVFVVAGVEYALPVEAVLQMETFDGATAVPGAPAYVAGIVTVRGRVTPVMDLRIRFGLPPSECDMNTRIIVCHSGERVVALRVDAAREVLKLDVEKHQPAPSIVSERSSGFVYAVHSIGTRLLLLIDLPKVLGENAHDHEPHALLDADGFRRHPALPG